MSWTTYGNWTWPASPGNATACIVSVLSRPKSRGALRLRDADPTSHPVIRPGYLSAPDDVDTLAGGLRFSARMVATRAMKEAGIEPWGPEPHCGHKLKYGTDEYWECYIRQAGFYSRSSRAREKMSVSKLQLFLLDVLMERLACDVDICQGRLWSCYFVNCRYNHDTLSLIFVKSNDHSALFVLHCFCRRWAVTVYHPVGTCSMGVVVDSRWHSTPELLRREKKSLVWTYYSSSRFLFRIDFIQSTY